ncbi:MAG TPA: hypothetical protein VGV07_25840 [Devosia sp.]|jgi:hypothetical protein|uniref:hypothetical protein n=1 Tax=Devosia sp. TaxID=1871048 RepID=UPI002DDCFC7D|nr:hypothetical protein [Devosia sp.]HEV2518695.1 hypothetical protein [Devosia sp.]
MGATVLAALLAGGLGLIAGGYYSTVGWIVVGSLLLVTTATASFAAHADVVATLGWIALSIVAFSTGLMLGLIIRRPVVLSPA